LKGSAISLTDMDHHFILTGVGKRKALPLIVTLVLLSACSTSPQGRLRIATPAPLSNMYSAVDMHMQLATAINVIKPCSSEECSMNNRFDLRVQQLGSRLALSAVKAYPEWAERGGHFEFVIAEKDELGSTSNASGRIVIYRGVQKRHPNEKALAYVLAREMGHVVGRHHDENAAPRIMLSILTAAFFPALNIIRAATPTSYIGSELIMASVKPAQLREADAIALKLLEGLGWSKLDVVTALDYSAKTNANDAWTKHLRRLCTDTEEGSCDSQAQSEKIFNKPAGFTVSR